MEIGNLYAVEGCDLSLVIPAGTNMLRIQHALSK
jgi:hypothetical protein